MRRAACALALLAGCGGARGPARTPRAAPASALGSAARAGWTRVAPRDRPPRIDVVAALDDGELVIVAGSAVYRVDARGGVVPVCALDRGLGVSALHASGARWWALAGDAFEPTVFHGAAAATGCARSSVPPLVSRDAPPGHLRSALVGDDAVVWSSAGAMARSRDGARTWQRIPSLPEVAAVTSSGGALYAAALLGGPASRAPFDRHAYEVFTLPEAAGRWTAVPTPGDRAAPVALLPRAGGGVVGLDVLGGFELTAEGVGGVALSRGPHFARDRAQVLVASSRGSALGRADAGFFAVGLAGSRPLPSLPADRVATAFAATPDGALVVADARELWRLREGGAPEVVLRSPLEGGRPTRLAARGAVIAALTGRDRLSVSRDGGASWATVTVPGDAGRPRGLSVLPDGAVIVVAGGAAAAPSGALWIFDPAPHRVELARGARVVEGGATLRAIGDRWLLAAGDVFVSDDQGARWRPTLVAPAGEGEAWGVVGLATAEGRGVFALDTAGGVWRSDDAGDEFVVIHPGRSPGAARVAPLYAPPAVTADWIHWDGADAVLVGAGRQVLRFDREGRGGPLGGVRGAVFGAAVEGGAIVALSAATARVGECGRDAEALLAGVTPQGEAAPIADLCAHEGVVFALDGDALYLADADGTIERASLRGLARETLGRAPP